MSSTRAGIIVLFTDVFQVPGTVSGTYRGLVNIFERKKRRKGIFCLLIKYIGEVQIYRNGYGLRFSSNVFITSIKN